MLKLKISQGYCIAFIIHKLTLYKKHIKKTFREITVTVLFKLYKKKTIK